MYQDLNAFVIISVNTVSAERTFSKLELLKIYLRNSMIQEKLRNLAILPIEHSMAEILTLMVSSTLLLNRKPEKKNLIIKIFTKNKMVILVQYTLSNQYDR